MAKKTSKKTNEQLARETMALTGWCFECALSGCAQGFCCGSPQARRMRGENPGRFVDSDQYDD